MLGAILLAGAISVTGTVTHFYHNGATNGVLAPSDGSPAFWFEYDEEYPLRLGDLVTVTGEMTPLIMAPGMLHCELKFLAHQPLPPASAVELHELAGGKRDNERVALSGVLTACAPCQTAGYVTLSLVNEEGTFAAEVPFDAYVWPELIDSDICLSGVAMSIFNIRGEFVGVVMRSVSMEHFQVTPVKDNPFTRPLTALDGIFPYSPTGVDMHRRHVRGTVTYVKPNEFLWIADGEKSLKIHAAVTDVRPGDVVEAVGFATRVYGLGQLDKAIVRKIGSGQMPEAVRVGWVELDGYPYDTKKSCFRNYDGRYAVLEGRVLSFIESDGVVRMVVDCNKVEVTIEVEGGGLPLRAEDLSWKPSIRVRGVLELTEDRNNLKWSMPAIAGWTMRVESGEAVEIMDDAAYEAHQEELRNERQAQFVQKVWYCVIGALSFALFVAGIILLRARGQRKALDLLTAERKRMAADLHDTLEQHLAGARLVLNTAATFAPELPAGMKRAVGEVNEILAHAKTDLRARIFNMRSDVLFSKGPEAALKSIAERIARTGGITVRTKFRVLPAKMGDSLLSEILFIVSEAITNAVKHGKAKTIVIASDPLAGGGFSLSVANDGEPFDPQAVLGPEAGHYGLTGMRERAKRAGIGLEIVSEGKWMVVRCFSRP